MISQAYVFQRKLHMPVAERVKPKTVVIVLLVRLEPVKGLAGRRRRGQFRSVLFRDGVEFHAYRADPFVRHAARHAGQVIQLLSNEEGLRL